jgi:hypothetical protein
VSRGATPRKWCSEACRKRAERKRAVDAALEPVGGTTGTVESAVRGLIDVLDIDANSYAAALAELVIAQGRMVDGGNTHASVALRVTLEALDAVMGLRPPDGDWFSLAEISMCITKEGVDPDSSVGRALTAAGLGELITFRPPPAFPSGWRGTALDGDPADFAEKNGGDYPRTGGLEFWPGRWT